jgi:putative ABC transport system substrate-binding protein
MQRRTFLKLLGASAAALPLPASARQSTPVVGFVGLTSAAEWTKYVAAFRAGLSDAGFTESRDVTVEYRWAEGHYDRLPAIMADFVNRPVDVIVPIAPPAMRAAKAATKTIPIVFFTGADPVALGIVSNLSRPEGNITGATALANSLGPKRFEALRDVVPDADTYGMLVNPTNPNAVPDTNEVMWAAKAAGKRLVALNASKYDDIAAAFRRLSQDKIPAVIINPDPFLLSQRKQIAALARSEKIATIFHLPAPVAAGGLMSYGASFVEAHHTVGVYVGRILKGAKPGDLPIPQPTKFDLAINLETAKAIGLKIPLTLLARADEVIE